MAQDLNEHRLPGLHVGHDELEQIKQDALGVGGRTDLAVRQARTRKHRCGPKDQGCRYCSAAASLLWSATQ